MNYAVNLHVAGVGLLATMQQTYMFDRFLSPYTPHFGWFGPVDCPNYAVNLYVLMCEGIAAGVEN